MKLEEILKQWENDCIIKKDKLDDESIRLSMLHSFYLSIYAKERNKLIDQQNKFKTIRNDRLSWYRGTLTEDEIRAYNWGIQSQKLINEHIKTYMEGDKELLKYVIAIEKQQEKVNILQRIIDFIKDRGFQIKNTIDWIKYSNGF